MTRSWYNHNQNPAKKYQDGKQMKLKIDKLHRVCTVNRTNSSFSEDGQYITITELN